MAVPTGLALALDAPVSFKADTSVNGVRTTVDLSHAGYASPTGAGIAVSAPAIRITDRWASPPGCASGLPADDTEYCWDPQEAAPHPGSWGQDSDGFERSAICP